MEVVIPDRLPTDRADIVVFSDDDCKRPYAVVECKKDGVTDAEFNQAIEQGVGNATWVKLRAEYVVIIAGSTRRVLDFTDNFGVLEREQNIIADLPKSYGKPQEFRFYKGAVNANGEPVADIAPVSREDLIVTIKKCHQTLWGGGRLSPPTAFGELCKLIFVKISDEQKARKKGEPYQFQIKTHEPSSKLAERINKLYDEQKVKDPDVFTESIKVDDRVLRTVVSHLESINLNKTDLDVKGVAFEQFMDGFFKGDFGQYFTPRPIIEFAVQMMKPEHDWNVLDPACGSGGFLLHALDFMRTQAEDYYDKKTQAVDYYNYWHDFASKHLYGIEINDEIARVAKMNMIVHDDGHTNVISFDALDSIDKMHDHNQGFGKNKFDLILTNPPFGSTINKAEKPYLESYELGNTYDAKDKKKPRKNQSSEILFIERIWEFLKPGTGKAAIILPDGILTNSSSQYVRDFILEKFQLLAVVSLPQCAFAHFGANVKSSLVFLQKRDLAIINKPYYTFCATPDHIGYDASGKQDISNFDYIVKEFQRFQREKQLYSPKTDTSLSCCVYIISSKEITGKEIFCNSKYPQYLRLMEQYKASKWCRGTFDDYLGINPKTDCSNLDDEDIVSFIPMTAVGEKDNTVVPETRNYGSVKKGYTVFQKGDLLWAKITPCMQNGKSCLTDSITTQIGFGSTEFHVIRKKSKDVYMPYIWAILSNDDVLDAAQAVFNGSAGQQRVSESFLKNFPAILPDYDTQVRLTDELSKKQEAIVAAKKRAEKEWAAAKAHFEKELLGE